MTKFCIPHPYLFCSHARTRQNIAILKKLVHGRLLYTCANFDELWPTNPRSRRRFTIFFKLRFLAYISGAAERTFAKLLPMVDLGCVQIPQYLGSCDVFPTLHGGPKNVEILHIFGPPYSHARTRQNIAIPEKTGSPRKVALHLCQFRRTLAHKPLRSRRRFTIF